MQDGKMVTKTPCIIQERQEVFELCLPLDLAAVEH